jgi:indole-3-glycerol phosphate synthase
VTYLDAIVSHHRARAAADGRSESELHERAVSMPATRGFAAAVRRASAESMPVIAEIKRRSPSKGVLFGDGDAAALATEYESAGATCLSVLTDSNHFGGSPDDLVAARRATALPVLRKDFTVSRRDVYDARLMGADCVLLIAAALSVTELVEFASLARELAMDALVEIHDENEIDAAVAARTELVGVNQRDLLTFNVDRERAVRLGSLLPRDIVRVAESGVRSRDDSERLRAAGYHAVLVGESLVTSSHRGDLLAELRLAVR